jgi:hypothetical protein
MVRISCTVAALCAITVVGGVSAGENGARFREPHATRDYELRTGSKRSGSSDPAASPPSCVCAWYAPACLGTTLGRHLHPKAALASDSVALPPPPQTLNFQIKILDARPGFACPPTEDVYSPWPRFGSLAPLQPRLRRLQPAYQTPRVSRSDKTTMIQYLRIIFKHAVRTQLKVLVSLWDGTFIDGLPQLLNRRHFLFVRQKIQTKMLKTPRHELLTWRHCLRSRQFLRLALAVAEPMHTASASQPGGLHTLAPNGHLVASQWCPQPMPSKPKVHTNPLDRP